MGDRLEMLHVDGFSEYDHCVCTVIDPPRDNDGWYEFVVEWENGDANTIMSNMDRWIVLDRDYTIQGL